MSFKGVKETFAKLGFKSSGSKHHPTSDDSDKSKLLERILSLESQRLRNTQQLLAKDQEIYSMWELLRAEHGEVVASLQTQLDQIKQGAEQKEKDIQSLLQEIDDLKNKLKHSNDMQVNFALVQEQLRDALEKNQHWLVYDQQREFYVQWILSRIVALEQQLNQATLSLLQQHKEANSEGQAAASMQQEIQLQEKQSEIEEDHKRTSRLQAELEELKARYEDKSREVVRAQEELQEERRSVRQTLAEERKLNTDRVARLQCKIEAAGVRLEEERKRAAEQLLQIQLYARHVETEKLDRQRLQHQLHKVLKKLCMAREQIERLEAEKQQQETRFSEPSSYTRMDLDQITTQDCISNPTSPVKNSSTLNESFLECPICRASYCTSHHRELLAHLDNCLN